MDAGFERGGLRLVSVNPGVAGFRDARLNSFYQALLQQVESLPGVRAASLSLITPIAGGGVDFTAKVEGYTPQPHEDNDVYVNYVSPGYFAAFGTPLLAGRDFAWHDRPESPSVAMINESMARYYFHGASPLGRWVALGNRPPAQIIGVVADAKYINLREPVPSHSLHGRFPGATDVRFTAAGGAHRLETRCKSWAQFEGRWEPSALNVPIGNETTFEQLIDQSLIQERLMATLSGFFGALALLLAAIGLYGVLAYAVRRRTSEIGIRMALGADRTSVLWMVLRETVGLVLCGIAVGLPLALAATRLIGKFLFGLTPADPLTLAIAVVTLLATAAMAGFLPARRASSIDPMVALRYE